jgi:hypothetical protein
MRAGHLAAGCIVHSLFPVSRLRGLRPPHQIPLGGTPQIARLTPSTARLHRLTALFFFSNERKIYFDQSQQDDYLHLFILLPSSFILST